MTGTADKTALVTGAGRRIGRAIALSLGRAGWRIAVHFRDSEAGAGRVVDEIVAAGGEARAFRADLANREDVSALAEAAAAYGPISCLVNNASVFERDDIGSLSLDSWDRHIEVNLLAPLMLGKSLRDRLPEGVSGNIINMIDQRVWRLTPNFLSYTVSKSALWTLTQTLAMALAPSVRVNGIGPGPVLPSRRQTSVSFAKQVAALPLSRGPEPEEICRAVHFILDSPSMTGQMLALDGGQHLAWRTPDVTAADE